MIEMNKNSRDAAGIVKDCGTKKALTGAQARLASFAQEARLGPAHRHLVTNSLRQATSMVPRTNPASAKQPLNVFGRRGSRLHCRFRSQLSSNSARGAGRSGSLTPHRITKTTADRTDGVHRCC